MPGLPSSGWVAPYALLTSHDEEIEANFNSLEEWSSQEPWKTPVLNGKWKVPGGFQTPQYVKDPLGWVHLRGIVQNTAEEPLLFTLPEGYRPKKNEDFFIGTNTTTVSIQVTSTGEVKVAAGLSILEASVSGVSFYPGE